LTFTLMPAASTHKLSIQVSDFEEIGLLIQLARLYAISVRRASALPAASFRFHLTMDTLAVRLTIPPVGLVEDFHLQMSAPCRAHRPVGAALRGRPRMEIFDICDAGRRRRAARTGP